MKFYIILLLSFASLLANGQDYKTLNNWFSEAYEAHPNLPDGILEAISYNMTRVYHHMPDESMPSCTGMPQTYGIMGLYLDGKDNFDNTLLEVAKASEYSVEELIQSPQKNIMGTANWLSAKLSEKSKKGANSNNDLLSAIQDAAGLPDYTLSNEYVRDIFALQVLKDMQNGITMDGSLIFAGNEEIEPSEYFSDEKLEMLNSGFIDMSGIEGNNSTLKNSADYPPALWDEACTSNFSNRNSSVTHVTIHTAQGSYAGTISWFNNCSSNVSAHYVISNTGQVTQMVREYKKAWHVGSGNPYSIGIEHEGFIDNPNAYTTAMYQASANLVKDITQSGYSIPPTSCYNGSANPNGQVDPQPTNLRIKGHSHYPISANSNYHTDPGQHWNWSYYYDLINGGGGGNCPATRSVTGSISSGTYEASSSITSTGTVSSGTVTFRSPTIYLNDGFTVSSGTFYAQNAGCSSNLNAFDGENLSHSESVHKKEAEQSFYDFSVQPNPFGSYTQIQFALSEEVPVTIWITDMMGGRITTLANQETKSAGEHQVTFEAANYAAGMYFANIQAGTHFGTQKMILTK